MREIKSSEISLLVESLESMASRIIDSIIVVGLHGTRHELSTVDAAIDYVTNYRINSHAFEFAKFEIIIRYTNDDKVEIIPYKFSVMRS